MEWEKGECEIRPVCETILPLRATFLATGTRSLQERRSLEFI